MQQVLKGAVFAQLGVKSQRVLCRRLRPGSLQMSALLVLAGWESCLLAGLDRRKIGSVLVLRPTVPACDSIKLERLAIVFTDSQHQGRFQDTHYEPQRLIVDLAA